jgi:hypothetical protein
LLHFDWRSRHHNPIGGLSIDQASSLQLSFVVTLC